jgi:hypothetical protein
MKRSRFSDEQIIAIVKEQEAGMATAEVCRRLIPILPPAILYRRYPGVIEGGFGECAQVGGCELSILVLGERLGLAVCHMRQQPSSQTIPLGYGLIGQSLAGFDEWVAHYRAILRRD